MSWVDKSLDELGFLSRGKSRHRPRDAAHLYGGLYPFVQTGDVKHAGLYLSNYKKTYSEEGLAQSKLWPVGTLCITIAANIADTSILKIEACFPDSVIGFIADEKKADARFIKYLFDAVLKLQYKQFTQGAAQDNLSQGKLLSIKFKVPEDVLEQTRIADLISKYDELIENNNRRIELLEESAKLLYQEWFVHLRFPKFESSSFVNGIPEGWEVGLVSDFFNTASGGTPSRKNLEYYTGKIPWITTKQLKGKFIFQTTENITEQAIEKSSTKLFAKNTVLVAMYGATIGALGIVSTPSATNQACCALIPKHPNSNYIYAYLFLQVNKAGLINLGKGSAQINVSQQIIKSFPMTLPKKEIMDAFYLNVHPIFEQKKCLELQNIQLVKARDLLLPKIMSGEITV